MMHVSEAYVVRIRNVELISRPVGGKKFRGNGDSLEPQSRRVYLHVFYTSPCLKWRHWLLGGKIPRRDFIYLLW